MRVVRNRSFWGVGGGLTEENLFSDKKNYVIYFSLDKKNQSSFKFCTQKNILFTFLNLSDLSHFSERLAPNQSKNRTLILKIKWLVPFV